MRSEHTRRATITTADGDAISVMLDREGDREAATLTIDGVSYHLERLPAEEIATHYRVDLDEGYRPVADAAGYCYILAPFSA